MTTLKAVALVIQSDPSHVGGGEVVEGHFVTEGDEKSGNDEVIKKCTPDPKSDVDPPDKCKFTVEPGSTSNDES